MRETRIILVEGMPGTGKSTASQFIHLQLHANGMPSYWCHEERASHPLRLFYKPERHLSESNYSEEAASRWQSYAQELFGKDQIAVLDAALLQNHVRSMLIFDCDRNAILDLVGRIANLIASLNPTLIYLKPNDLERNFRDVVNVRGQRMLDLWIEAHDQYPYTRRAQTGGYPGFITFWKEFDEISERIIERLSMPSLQQNTSSNESGIRHDEILDFLELPLPSKSSSSPALERFTGKYVSVNDETVRSFDLRARDGCLVASCDQPTIDVHRDPFSCFREVQLIPKGRKSFYVAAWPHEVQFQEDRKGAIVNMRVSISEDGWEQVSQVYVKQ